MQLKNPNNFACFNLAPPTNTEFCKSPSQKLVQELRELKAYINSTSAPLRMIDVEFKSHTLQVNRSKKHVAGFSNFSQSLLSTYQRATEEPK